MFYYHVTLRTTLYQSNDIVINDGSVIPDDFRRVLRRHCNLQSLYLLLIWRGISVRTIGMIGA